MAKSGSPSLKGVLFAGLASVAALYFTYAAVEGDYGLFRRVQVEARTAELEAELEALEAEVAAHRNLTRRLSDDYLDVDLLDERVRDVLGYVREGEIVLR